MENDLPQHNLRSISGGVFFKQCRKNNTLRAKAALEAIRKQPGITPDEVFKLTNEGIGNIPAGYVERRFDAAIDSYRYYPAGQAPSTLPKLKPIKPSYIKCGFIEVTDRIFKAIAAINPATNTPLYNFSAEDWLKFATFDNLQRADNLSYDAIVSIWEAMLVLGVVPKYTISAKLPTELSSSIKLLTEKYKK